MCLLYKILPPGHWGKHFLLCHIFILYNTDRGVSINFIQKISNKSDRPACSSAAVILLCVFFNIGNIAVRFELFSPQYDQ